MQDCWYRFCSLHFYFNGSVPFTLPFITVLQLMSIEGSCKSHVFANSFICYLNSKLVLVCLFLGGFCVPVIGLTRSVIALKSKTSPETSFSVIIPFEVPRWRISRLWTGHSSSIQLTFVEHSFYLLPIKWTFENLHFSRKIGHLSANTIFGVGTVRAHCEAK